MVHAGRSIQFLHDGRQLDGEAPFVGPPTRRDDRVPPARPPRRDEPRNRLDDEQAVAWPPAIEQTRQQRVARRGGQLVHRKRGKDGARRFQMRRCRVGALGPRRAVRTRDRCERPRPVPTGDDRSRGAGASGRPRSPMRRRQRRCRSRGPPACGPASSAPGSARDDFADQEIVQRARRTARTRHASPRRRAPPLRPRRSTPLDVRRRQRAQRPRHFGKGEVGEMPSLERLHPAIEAVRRGMPHLTGKLPEPTLMFPPGPTTM